MHNLRIFTKKVIKKEIINWKQKIFRFLKGIDKFKTNIEASVNIIWSEPLQPNVISTPPSPINISCPFVYALKPSRLRINQVKAVDIGVKKIERGIYINSLIGKIKAINNTFNSKKRCFNEKFNISKDSNNRVNTKYINLSSIE